MVLKCNKCPSNIPNGHKIYQHLPIYKQGPPKFTQYGISGLKINHLATLGLAPANMARLSPFHNSNKNMHLL
jgi:hypothetical protein